MNMSNNLPQSHTVLGIVEALNGTEEIRQRVLGVSADEGEEDPGSEERRLGAPALLRKISPGRNAAGQEQEERGGREASEAVHCGNKLSNKYDIYQKNKSKRLLYKCCVFTLRGHHSKAKICAAAPDVRRRNTAKLSFKGAYVLPS